LGIRFATFIGLTPGTYSDMPLAVLSQCRIGNTHPQNKKIPAGTPTPNDKCRLNLQILSNRSLISPAPTSTAARAAT
jgi:hypothetical protein